MRRRWLGPSLTLYVVSVDIQRHPSGAATITAIVGDFWTDAGVEIWGSGTGVRGPFYTVDTIRDSDGQPVWEIVFSTTYKQCSTMQAGTDWLDTESDTYDLIDGRSRVNRIGDSRYEAIAVWIESEGAPA